MAATAGANTMTNMVTSNASQTMDACWTINYLEPWVFSENNCDRLYKPVLDYVRQVAPSVNGPTVFKVNKIAIGTTYIILAFSFVFSKNIIILLQYGGMSLVRVKCEQRKYNAICIERKWVFCRQRLLKFIYYIIVPLTSRPSVSHLMQ